MSIATALDPKTVYASLGLPGAPLIADVRDADDVRAQPRMIPGTLRRDAKQVNDWVQHLPPKSALAICCSDDGLVGREVAESLASCGYAAGVIAGGIEAWIGAGLPTVRVRSELGVPGGSRWITRERPKIDRLACPWLIRRFIDPEAQFFYTPPHRVREQARALGAEPYDIAEVTFSHRGSHCSFDAFLQEFGLQDQVVNEVAQIVRAADTGMLSNSREAPGLLAISLGMSANVQDDVVLLEQAMAVYDALYAWRKTASHETHSWPQSNA